MPPACHPPVCLHSPVVEYARAAAAGKGVPGDDAASQAIATCWERGWKGAPTGEVDWARINVNGSSVALGHPWAATGGRIVTTLANEMARRDASLGLVSICAGGAMAGALLLERS